MKGLKGPFRVYRVLTFHRYYVTAECGNTAYLVMVATAYTMLVTTMHDAQYIVLKTTSASRCSTPDQLIRDSYATELGTGWVQCM